MRRMAKAIDASIMEVHWDKRNWCFTFITDMSAILLKTIKPRKAIKTYNRFTPNRDSTSEINFIDGGLLSAYNVPAMIIELKRNQTTGAALAQIENKQYFNVMDKYQGDLLLVAVNYDEKTNEHTCEIRRFVK